MKTCSQSVKFSDTYLDYTMKKKRKNYFLLARKIHMYAGLIMIPYLLFFGISGFIFNHPTFLSNRTSSSFNMDNKKGWQALFPDIQILARSLTDSLRARGVIKEGRVANLQYDQSMIIRKKTDQGDYRMEIDVPSSNARLLVLPDFVDHSRLPGGQVMLDKATVAHDQILEVSNKVLNEHGAKSGHTRIQRFPRLMFDIKNKTQNYRVTYNLSNGNYRLQDLNKRRFKVSYFFTNLHEQHGYPPGRFSIKTLSTFLADCFAILLIIWGITGLYMWYKFKRYHAIGAVLLSIAIVGAFLIIMLQTDLGY